MHTIPRLSFRRLALLSMATLVAILSCGREPTAPSGRANAGVTRSQGIAFLAEFPKAVAAFQAAGGTGVQFTKVRVVLNNPDGSVALDTVVNFPANAEELQLTLSVPLPPSAPASGAETSMATSDSATAKRGFIAGIHN